MKATLIMDGLATVCSCLVDKTSQISSSVGDSGYLQTSFLQQPEELLFFFLRNRPYSYWTYQVPTAEDFLDYGSMTRNLSIKKPLSSTAGLVPRLRMPTMADTSIVETTPRHFSRSTSGTQTICNGVSRNHVLISFLNTEDQHLADVDTSASSHRNIIPHVK
jgi:hypothetical protein